MKPKEYIAAIEAGEMDEKLKAVYVTDLSLIHIFANKEPLIREIDDLVGNLEHFRKAIDEEDSETLKDLMAHANLSLIHI